MSTLFRFQVYKRVRTLTIYSIWNCKEKSVTDPPYMLSRIIVHLFYSKVIFFLFQRFGKGTQSLRDKSNLNIG